MQPQLKLHLYRIIFLLLLLTVSSTVISSSQEDPIIKGEETYIAKCASCHGKDAKGINAADNDLGVNSPDLTLISKRNNGQFPVSRIYAIIDGREDVQKHGTRAMPTWGSLFLSDTIWEGCSQVDETIVRGRIMELILYLDSIQQ